MQTFNIDKKIKGCIIIMLIMAAFCSPSYAQFYDLNETSNEQIFKADEQEENQSGISFIEDGISEEPLIETSGDEGGFIPEQDPDIFEISKENSKRQDTTIPIADSLETFSGKIAEESIKEQLRGLAQLDHIGFLDPNFDENLWKGVSFEQAKKKLQAVGSSKIGSIHAKRILRNMMVAKATPPKALANQSWLLLRLQTLADMGNLSDIQLMTKEINPKELLMLGNMELNKFYLQSNILNADVNVFLKTLLQNNPSDGDLKKLFLINLYSQNKIQQAKLSFQALTDSNTNVANSGFAKIFSALLNEDRLNLVNSELNVYEQYVVALNPELFEDVNYAKFKDKILLNVVNKAKDLKTTVNVAETLMNVYPYSYNIDNLNKVYEEYRFSAKDLSVPLKFMKRSTNEYKKRALLYQSSKIAGLNSTKAVALKKLWESYEKAGLNNIKLLITEKTQSIALNSSIVWFSQDILKGQLLHANIDYSTLKILFENIDQGYANSKFLNLQIALEFLRRTSVVGVNVDSIQDYKEILAYWFNANKLNSKENYNYVMRVLTLLDAMQAPIPEEIWTALYEKSSLYEKSAQSNPIWLRLVSSAIEREEKGSALLLIIDSFVNKKPADLTPQTLANVISCLNFLNMTQEMTLIGMEAILPN
ncbi:MAG: hypothetical protein GY793_03210 [Proteobacteria bacterium]|nr:hypothetical protein [Pseudomonadota bacterium]